MKLASLILVLGACGSSGSTVDAAAQHDAPVQHDARPIDGPPAGPSVLVKNYDAWCSVTVNGGTASSAATQTVTVTPGTIPLSAVALTGFRLGATPWHDTAGDTGSGDPGTVTGTGQSASSATTVVVGSTQKCVWVCCEFSTGGGCPTTNQCP